VRRLDVRRLDVRRLGVRRLGGRRLGAGRLACGLLAGVALLLAGCDQGRSGTLEDLLYLERPGYEGQEVSDERIQELQQSIDRFRERVNEKVEAAGQLGEYYKMLANAYIDRRMYGLALDTLQNAIEIEPENQRLFYLAGVSAGRMGKALVGSPEEQEQMFSRAESYYQRAIDLQPDYFDALYGLGVLYAFEMDRPEDAIPLLERVTQQQQGNARALSVLARAYAATGQTSKAAETYGRVAEVARDPQMAEQARTNRQELLRRGPEGSSQ
jgi:tetratricopeptide (TPR) repeat protein